MKTENRRVMVAVRKDITTSAYASHPTTYYLRKAGGAGAWSPDLRDALLFETEEDTPEIRLHHPDRGTTFSLARVSVAERTEEIRRELVR